LFFFQDGREKIEKTKTVVTKIDIKSRRSFLFFLIQDGRFFLCLIQDGLNYKEPRFFLIHFSAFNVQ